MSAEGKIVVASIGADMPTAVIVSPDASAPLTPDLARQAAYEAFGPVDEDDITVTDGKVTYLVDKSGNARKAKYNIQWDFPLEVWQNE